MTHQVDMILDFQYGSTGKGLIAGYLAKREKYDTVVCAFATNAGHTYIDKSRDMHVMTQQLPTAAIASPTVKNVLIGPGALIHAGTLMDEIAKYSHWLEGKQIMIHPHAAIVEDYHATQESDWGMTKIGSTTKGVGAAAVERIKRRPNSAANVAKFRLVDHWLGTYVCTEQEYREVLDASENVLVEGAQGYSLSMYHGQYPYTTSRDVTPWQVAADCGLPYKWASYIRVIGTMRTYPIRVSNRDGSSGPHYPDQREIAWQDIGIKPELTTVTKLPRRIFTFSQQQATEAAFHCGGYWATRIFLNFANYCDPDQVDEIRRLIEEPRPMCLNAPKVHWFGYGADDKDVLSIEEIQHAG
jgi:adenylosuccinate synthase